MATTTTCPLCGHGQPLPPEYTGGPITCSNSACGQVFEAGVVSREKSIAGSVAAVASTAARAKQRAPGSRPELLDKLPTSFWISPPMVAVGGVSVLLYGMVLFAIVSARRNQPEPPSVVPRETMASLAPLPPSEPPPTLVSSPVDKSALKGREPRKSAPPRPEVAVAADAAKPESVKNEPSAPTVESVKKAPTPTPAPMPPPVVAAPPPQPPRTEKWGPLAASLGDCAFLPDGTGLTVGIPGTLHILSPELNIRNSPRLLTDVQGDFTAQVTVAGRISPGTDPLPNFPFTFQGAGLLLWQDENNYLRLERTSIFSEDRRRLHQVLLEFCRGGKILPTTIRDARDSDITLRYERRGSEVRCSYSPDGRTWLEVKRQNVSFPASVKVGISASNASPNPYPARFTKFDLTKPGARPGSGS
ncbi:MAG: hypothetical protein NVSMB9_01730 [Isosphaeraceae bacterium]